MIIPALLTTNERIAKERIALAQNMSGWLHVDLLDHSLYKFDSLSIPQLSQLDFGDLSLEIHAMTNEPHRLIESKLPIERVIMHYELKHWHDLYTIFRNEGMEVWLAIAPATPIDTLELPADLTGAVMMGVEPGKTGQSLLSETFERLQEFRDYYPDCALTVDGGVTSETIRELLACGVDNLVMGSAIFSQPNPVEAYQRYTHLSDPIGGLYEQNPSSRIPNAEF